MCSRCWDAHYGAAKCCLACALLGQGRAVPTGTVAGWWYGLDAASYEYVLHQLDQERAGTRKAHRPCPESADLRAVLLRPLKLRP